MENLKNNLTSAASLFSHILTLVSFTHRVRRCSLWAPASPSCGLVGTCVEAAGASVDVGEDGGGGVGEGEVRARVRVPVRSRAQTPPCEPPARTVGLGILA